MDFQEHCFLVDPGYIFNWHFDVIHHELQKLFNGETQRLMLLMPPRHGKSRHSCELFPSYWLAHKEKTKVMILTSGQDLSGIFGRQVKRIISSPPWQSLTEKRLSRDSSGKMEFTLTDGSEFYAIGKGGQVYGKGGNLIVIDDLIKDWKEANSSTWKESNYWWYRTVAESRLEVSSEEAAESSKMVFLNTRWRQDDLPGRIIEEEPELWTVVVIPAIGESDEVYVGSRGKWLRKSGTALWPQRYDLAELERRRLVMGREFTGLYQQQPTAGEGEIFKRSFWRYYSPDDLPAEEDIKMRLLSLDTAFKEEEQNDFSVLLGCIVTMDNRILITHLNRDRMRFSRLKESAETIIKATRPHYVIIEDKGSGTSLIQELEEDAEITRYSVIEGIPKKWSKEDYAHAVAYIVELGKVYLPEGANWTFPFVDELAEFPGSTHDDQTDALVQLLMFIRDNSLLSDLADLTDITAI